MLFYLRRYSRADLITTFALKEFVASRETKKALGVGAQYPRWKRDCGFYRSFRSAVHDDESAIGLGFPNLCCATSIQLSQKSSKKIILGDVSVGYAVEGSNFLQGG